MAMLTVRNLDEGLVRKLRVRAAEKGRSAEAEHREILRAVLEGETRATDRAEVAERLAAFRRKLAGCPPASSAELLDETRRERMQRLTGSGEGL